MKVNIKRVLHINSLKFRLLSFTLILLISTLVINIYSLSSIRSLENVHTEMIDRVFKIDNIKKEILSSENFLEQYFSTKTDSDLKNYAIHYQVCRDSFKYLQNIGLQKVNNSMEEEMLIKNIGNTLDSYKEVSNDSILNFYIYDRGEIFYSKLKETRDITNFIVEYTNDLQNEYLKYSEELSKSITESNKIQNKIILVILGFMVLSGVYFAVSIEKGVTKPLNQLTESAYKVATGEFNIPELKNSNIYELDVVTMGFNTMVDEIHKFINKMKEKADIEKKLGEEELKNLMAQNMLKESRLKMLQSQINPHFLFNTLNIIVITAMEEEAENTEKMINSLAELLRYSLNTIDHVTTVEKEIDIIKQYIYIQECRFGDRVKFNVDIDKSVLKVKLPGMILQPMVENALIHGIENKEEGGVIEVTARRIRDNCIVKIKDSGIGMTKEQIEKILKGNDVSKTKGHTTGLGVSNVISRLRLYFDNEDVINIFSEIGKGTEINLKIPMGG